jgi:hypothetical protein
VQQHFWHGFQDIAIQLHEPSKNRALLSYQFQDNVPWKGYKKIRKV